MLSVSLLGGESRAQPPYDGPPLSSIALLSRFAQEQGIAPRSLTEAPQPLTEAAALSAETVVGLQTAGANTKVNQDFSLRPQNETTIAVNPWSPNMLVAGANDYRLGAPIGAAFYTSFDGGFTWNDDIPPYPLLAATRGQDDEVAFLEPPFGTGDPVLAFGRARAGSPGIAAGTPVVYYAYLGVSASFCEHGIFLARSTNGLTWTRPVVPPLLPPDGLFTPIYWSDADDCGVFNDKPWLAVDTSGGPHDGRVYVTWSRFAFQSGSYQESPILMSYSDDNGLSWSDPIEVSGISQALCPTQGGEPIPEPPPIPTPTPTPTPTLTPTSTPTPEPTPTPTPEPDGEPILLPLLSVLRETRGPTALPATGLAPSELESERRCNESQFSSVVIGPDGTAYVAFINQQFLGAADGFRNQYLVTKIDPDTLAVSGPYRVTGMIDGENDFPVNSLGLTTLCNSNFRLATAGNLALDPSDAGGNTLYVVFADNRNGDSFPSPTQVTQEPTDSFACPPGTTTDADVFILKSSDGGVTWKNPNPAEDPSSPLRVNQDPLANGKDQWFPFAAVAPDGRVDVVFYDRRNDPLNRFTHAYLARSHDGGATWTETRLTDVPSNMNWAFENGLFIGDYNGMAIAPDGTTYPFWTDARNGNPLIRQSDVMMATVPP